MSGLLLAVLIASLQLAPEAPTITVAVQDEAGVPRDWLRQAKAELVRIYREVDVQIVLWDLNPSSSPGSGVAVLRNMLTVTIRQSPAALKGDLPWNAMGMASGTGVERGRVAYVFYSRIEQFTPLYRGRFLGHFMAHELGHLLLPQYSHSPTGLMRAQWNREDLERAQHGLLPFTPEQATLIRSRATLLASPP